MSKVLSLLLVFLMAPSVSTAKEGDLIQEVQKRTKALYDYQEQRRKVLDSLYLIQKNIKSIAKVQADITAKSQRLKVQMERSSLELVEMEESLLALRQRVAKSAMLLSQVDASSMMKILFASKSPAELDRTIKFFELIVQKELKVLKVYQDQVQDILKKQNDIQLALAEIQKSEQEALTAELALKKEHKTKLSLISKLDRRRQKEIASLQAFKLKSMRKIAMELGRDEVLKELLRPSFLEQKGRLVAPLPGEVVGTYGIVMDPELQTQTSMDGWFIAAAPGEGVRVPFEGKVAMVHYDPQLKNVMIIDHGHDYYTTYSNLEELEAQVGDSLLEGQIIGRAGYSPRWQADGIHFEIRHFSEPIDPGRWILKEKEVRKQASINQ